MRVMEDPDLARRVLESPTALIHLLGSIHLEYLHQRNDDDESGGDDKSNNNNNNNDDDDDDDGK